MIPDLWSKTGAAGSRSSASHQLPNGCVMIKNWSNEYALGIAEVDAQHKGFFETAHGLYDSILNCEGEKSVEETLEFLKDYANRHFQAEELLMAKHGFPGLPRH